MRNYDLTPLLRATVGFDRMFNMLDTATRLDERAPSYPPYNIEKTGEDTYRIVMAVAGFGEADLEVTAKGQQPGGHRQEGQGPGGPDLGPGRGTLSAPRHRDPRLRAALRPRGTTSA